MAKVLVAAADRTVGNDLRALLKDARFEVFEAGDGEESVRQYRLHRPDLALLDAELPGVGGVDVVRRIRREDADTGLILFSARSDEMSRALGLELGEDDYVVEGKDYCMRGQRTGRRFRLGDKLQIRVARCNLEKKQMDYELVSTEPA